MAFLSLSTIMDVYFYRLGIFFQSIFDVNSQVTWDTKLVTFICSFGNIANHSFDIDYIKLPIILTNIKK